MTEGSFANSYRVLITALVPLCGKLAVEMLATEFDIVFAGDVSAIRRNLVI